MPTVTSGRVYPQLLAFSPTSAYRADLEEVYLGLHPAKFTLQPYKAISQTYLISLGHVAPSCVLACPVQILSPLWTQFVTIRAVSYSSYS